MCRVFKILFLKKLHSMTQDEFWIPVKDEKLFGSYYDPNAAKAVVVLVHGMGEHSGRYADFVIPKLLNAKFGVIAYDQFGHGKTTGKRGHNPGYTCVLSALELMIEKARIIFGNLPVFIYGHSMGGNVVLNFGLKNPNLLQGIISSSPFLRLSFSPPGWKLRLAKWMQSVYPSITLRNGIDPNSLSRNPQAVEEYKNDPRVHDRVSPNYSIPFIRQGQWAMDHAKELQIPTLILHGTADQLTDHKASEAFAKANPEFVQLKLYPDCYHELHNEFVREEFLDYIVRWIEQNLKK